jgi:hypothetical protein
LFAQFRHPLAQLGQCHQIFLVGADQPLDASFQPCLFSTQLLLSFPNGIRISCDFSAPVDLRLNQRWILQ